MIKDCLKPIHGGNGDEKLEKVHFYVAKKDKTYYDRIKIEEFIEDFKRRLKEKRDAKAR